MDLNGYISLFIPTKDTNGRDLVVRKRAVVLHAVEVFFLDSFGGFTEYQAKCGWRTKNKFIIEDITIVQAFYEGEDKEVLAKVSFLAEVVKKKLNQDAVKIEMNGGISFI